MESLRDVPESILYALNLQIVEFGASYPSCDCSDHIHLARTDMLIDVIDR